MGHAPTILVEARKDENVKPILNSIAATCALAGHVVKRWRGPLSGRVPFSRRLPRCDLAILFNGTHESYAAALDRLAKYGSSRLVC